MADTYWRERKPDEMGRGNISGQDGHFTTIDGSRTRYLIPVAAGALLIEDFENYHIEAKNEGPCDLCGGTHCWCDWCQGGSCPVLMQRYIEEQRAAAGEGGG